MNQQYNRIQEYDFSIGNYFGKSLPMCNYFHMSHDLSLKTKTFLELVDKFKFIPIWDNYLALTKNKYNKISVYLLKVESGSILLKVTLQYVNGKIVENRALNNIVMGSNCSTEDFNLLKDEFVKNFNSSKEKTNQVSLIVKGTYGYETTPFDLPKNNLQINLNYGEAFMPVHNKILSTLNTKNSKGLVLLHGFPGTGKTHYLKYLASKIKNKKVLFVPPFLADFITSPDMTQFLIDNSNSILFIEDAERVISDRTTTGSAGVSNILNITDGILSDILNIQVVATFNMDKANIDKALLRKGRLIAEHKFEELSVEESNNLIKHLKFDFETKVPMTLTDIYNIGEVEYKSETKTKKIGF